jgi:hypothetical protein
MSKRAVQHDAHVKDLAKHPPNRATLKHAKRRSDAQEEKSELESSARARKRRKKDSAKKSALDALLVKSGGSAKNRRRRMPRPQLKLPPPRLRRRGPLSVVSGDDFGKKKSWLRR